MAEMDIKPGPQTQGKMRQQATRPGPPGSRAPFCSPWGDRAVFMCAGDRHCRCWSSHSTAPEALVPKLATNSSTGPSASPHSLASPSPNNATSCPPSLRTPQWPLAVYWFISYSRCQWRHSNVFASTEGLRRQPSSSLREPPLTCLSGSGHHHLRHLGAARVLNGTTTCWAGSKHTHRTADPSARPSTIARRHTTCSLICQPQASDPSCELTRASPPARSCASKLAT